MGKFHIGARVRDDDGDEGVILDKRKGERLVQHDDPDYGTMWRPKERLTALEVVANDNEVSACAPVFEKEYSVGDRVRVKTRDYGETQFGKTGVVVEINRPSSLSIEIEYDEPLTRSGLRRNQYMPDDLEPIEPAAAPATGPTTTPTFAKGDHALSQNGDYVTVDTDPDEVGHVWVSFGTKKWRTPVSWLSKWEPKVGDRVRRIATPFSFVPIGFESTLIENTDGELVYTDADADQMSFNQEDWEPLPVAEQPAAETTEPAPLVVEAGKSYRTRDGRKVGPLEDENGTGEWAFEAQVDGSAYADGTRCAWRVDGSFSPWEEREAHRLDLVAEWVEPVAEVAVAEATATKWVPAVGDKVRCIDQSGGSKFRTGDIYTVRSVEGDLVYVDEIEQAMFSRRFEPAAPPAKFKVGDKVDLYRDGKPVETWRNMTIIEADRDGVFEFYTDVGLLCNAHELRLAAAKNTITRGTLATLTTPARVAGQFGDKVNLVFPDLPAGRNSFALPASVLAAAA